MRRSDDLYVPSVVVIMRPAGYQGTRAYELIVLVHKEAGVWKLSRTRLRMFESLCGIEVPNSALISGVVTDHILCASL